MNLALPPMPSILTASPNFSPPLFPFIDSNNA